MGATGTIGKSVAHVLAARGRYDLLLVGRDSESLSAVARSCTPSDSAIGVETIDRLSEIEAGTILNCLGAGDHRTVRSLGVELMKRTEMWDNAILNLLQRSPGSRCIAFSSGVVYGLDWSEPVSTTTTANIPVNRLSSDYCYAIAKLNSETKHRAAQELNIIDARIFGYASRYIDPGGGFFLSDVMRAMKRKDRLRTSGADMSRDYLHPDDLCNFIELCIATHPVNRAFDLYSREPVSKFELLEALRSRFGLDWEVVGEEEIESSASPKSVYCSGNRDAETIGYHPRMSAMEAVVAELDAYAVTIE